ncbi:hypothetical protein DPEC_G00017490 [Dallia pectoralis]|uniref:Uncharacterized protein n=1 Tax=Dallia pectoralis TaxID=75939 RepID=A0ACC2HFV2_DALPE|nr:hypothetical protein DPEC_G00017490 [Dallia pectoralis]
MGLDEERMESTAERNMKSRCRDFLVEAGRQLQQRRRTHVLTEPGQVQTEEQNGTRNSQQHTPQKIWTEKTRHMLQGQETFQRLNSRMYSVGGASESRETDADEDSEDGF